MTTILITGATGNVGRPLVCALSRTGARVRAVTRQKSPTPFPAGVDLVGSALDGLPGADAAFVNSRALGEHLVPFVAAARRAGVRRLVALSAINADDDFSRQPSRFRGDRNQEAERLVVESGVEWVSLRPSLFVTNFVAMWGPQIAAGDVVAGPFACASTAPIVEADIAAVAAVALTGDDLLGRKVALTGPQAMTNSELVAVIAAVAGRRLRYREVPPAAVRQQFLGQGFSPDFADAYLAMLAESVGRTAVVTDEIERITGRPATTFAQAVRAHLPSLTAAAGVQA